MDTKTALFELKSGPRCSTRCSRTARRCAACGTPITPTATPRVRAPCPARLSSGAGRSPCSGLACGPRAAKSRCRPSRRWPRRSPESPRLEQMLVGVATRHMRESRVGASGGRESRHQSSVSPIRGEDHGAAPGVAIRTAGRPRPRGAAPRRMSGSTASWWPSGSPRMARNTRSACGRAPHSQSLLANLQSRGLRTDQGACSCLDGAQALHKATRAVLRSGARAPQHRGCGCNRATRLCDRVRFKSHATTNPTNVRIDETLTVAFGRSSGSDDQRRRESASRTRHVNQHGQMMLRWVAAGVLEAVKGFRRVKGCADMPRLVTVLRARDQRLGIAQ